VEKPPRRGERLVTSRHLCSEAGAPNHSLSARQIRGRVENACNRAVGDRFRPRIILLRLEGRSETEVARTLGCSMGAVSKWSKRFNGYGIAGLKDAHGRGRKARLPADKISLIVERATRPAQGRVRWNVRSMAREAEVSKSTAQRIWSHNEIKPHRLETFKISSNE
jgi:transposase